MSKSAPKIICITGPAASGKSSVATAIAMEYTSRGRHVLRIDDCPDSGSTRKLNQLYEREARRRCFDFIIITGVKLSDAMLRRASLAIQLTPGNRPITADDFLLA